MDIATGETKPDEGPVLRGKMSRSPLGEWARAAGEGIGWKFQKTTVFEDQAVGENPLTALRSTGGLSRGVVLPALGRKPRNRLRLSAVFGARDPGEIVELFAILKDALARRGANALADLVS